MLTIGRSNYMRFNHPAEAKIMKSVLPNPRISMASITFEPDNSFQSKYNKKPPAVPRKNSKESLIESGVEEPVPSSIMTKVSKFEYLAQQNFKKSISPKVFSSNLVTVNTPAKDVLGKSPPDLQNFSKNLPQNVLNYSEMNHNEKQQIKSSDRPMFGKKSPQYVNVTVSEKKNINNKVIIYENGCIPKNQNVECNEWNNKSSSNKNVNMNRALTPSPNYNRNPSPLFRSTTPNNCKKETEITENCNDAELKRTQAQQERIKEQEIGKAEQARLEEILNMCVEYEKQAQSEKNKLTPNRIKTNGSLPRDKRQYGPLSPVYTTPPPSPRDMEIVQHENRRNNSSYENITINRDNSSERINANYDNVDEFRTTKCNSPYENIVPAHQSPRTRIKTIASSNRDGKSKDTAEIIENKFAILEAEQYLLQNLTINDETNKIRETTKFIFPLEENSTSLNNNKPKLNNTEKIRKERKEILTQISSIKRHIAESEIHEEELQRDIELENALISGEHKAKLLELDKLEHRKEKLFKCAQKLEESMSHQQTKQDQDQLKCKEKLELAQERMLQIEGKLAKTPKSDPEYENVFEEYLKAQEVLDNEKKAFEDLEFHHLEEEADWLASREEVQREILDLTKKIDSVKEQIQELEQQKYNISKNNTTEVKIIRMRRDEYMRKLERLSLVLRRIDNELSVFAHQESDQEESTDSDSDKSKDLDKHLSNLSLNVIHDLSCSVIVSNTKTSIDHMYNMSQSFNEKLLQEKSVLETGIGTKCPSQDDIDRISKVTSSAPISINEQQGSLGRKTIESLKDIERMRHLHLCQQGSQVIEQERQRVLALKQRVQHEVRIKWAQSRQDCVVPDAGEKRNSVEIVERQSERPVSKSPTSNEQIRSGSSEADSPRPMSEISEISTDFGEISTKKRTKPHGDKQRPLTRYLPIKGSDLDLRQHIESAGHQVVLCPHVIINSSSCRGFLHKKGSKLNGWSKRWFVFDRNKHTLTYYNDKSEKKARGGAYFQAIEEVYLDHLNSVKSPNPQLTFIVKTHEKSYYLLAPSPEAMRIWVDVIFTGAEGYQEFEHGT
ncbi:pleckstrin homology-like domain family B member 2 [Tribolium madens]|uniref:pleckstrin homology-like domain family B member 2 n=1 Tax=Tribolium madens TaxID=41895 RepID=UPI001CF723C3|nr:pleckstrin homology-like domain family B member 2 [Tribolium madens]XP_044254064.1 pleckstrin homology-like domain family B member 2 [Tribolium madens]